MSIATVALEVPRRLDRQLDRCTLALERLHQALFASCDMGHERQYSRLFRS